MEYTPLRRTRGAFLVQGAKSFARVAHAQGRTAWPDFTWWETESELNVSEAWKPLYGHHYTTKELAEEWNLSDDYIRKVFADEPDVVLFMKPRRGRRTYRTLRIPAAVAERVYRRSQVA